jgi:hypothetical protein
LTVISVTHTVNTRYMVLKTATAARIIRAVFKLGRMDLDVIKTVAGLGNCPVLAPLRPF